MDIHQVLADILQGSEGHRAPIYSTDAASASTDLPGKHQDRWFIPLQAILHKKGLHDVARFAVKLKDPFEQRPVSTGPDLVSPTTVSQEQTDSVDND
jgi:hypothetical protein